MPATDDKYDRQLRLWGAGGQRALSETCVVLVRATAAGTETLKNLILPGVGQYVILDDVTETTGSGEMGEAQQSQEHRSNFFLVSSSSDDAAAPKPRAQVACELLQELNPDVQGSFQHVETGLNALNWGETLHKLAAAASFKLLVIASDLEPALLQAVADACAGTTIAPADGSSSSGSHHYPLVAVHSYGLLGIVRLQVTPSLSLLQPKLKTNPDLRLARPFCKLLELYRDQLHLDQETTWQTMDDHLHGHVPYPLILLQALDLWRKSKASEDQSLVPATFAEKEEFKLVVKRMARNLDKELNFEQAVDNAFLAYTTTAGGVDWQEHVAELKTAAAAANDDKLSIIVQALEQFGGAESSQPPVAGTIPDMAASTDLYIQLQQVYQAQAAEDWNKLKTIINSIDPNHLVSDDDITNVCQNVSTLSILQTGKLSALPPAPTSISPTIAEGLLEATMEGNEERPEHTPLLWLMGFLACQLFFQQQSARYPGVTAEMNGYDGTDQQYESDIRLLQSHLQEVIQVYGLAETELVQSTNLAAMAHELTRYANAEIHTIASIVGGVASQEAIKVITGQYVPIDNLYVYNGIASTAAVYKL